VRGGLPIFARGAAVVGIGVALLLSCAHDSVGAEPPFASTKPPSALSEPSLTTLATTPSLSGAGMPVSPSPSPGVTGTPVGMFAGAGAVGGSAAVEAPGNAPPADRPCDLSGEWILQHVTRNSALGAVQTATNWHYHRIAQQGDRFTITKSVDCGFAVRGTTDASLSDATLEAIAVRSPNATGVAGTSALAADGRGCTLAFDRAYSIRGADRVRFLESVWKVGDPPKDLSEFALPTSAANGMEDWDDDGHEGVTQTTGFGERYGMQLDWNAVHGQAPLHPMEFGGEGTLALDYDARESIAAETPALLQTTGTPMPPGYAFMARVDGELEASAAQGTLQFCKQVQALSVAKFGDPARQ
jgi:hypothetical protein